jgi:6-pyruvoyltetrahydropterin/6-carboxytetrahydropterin synthase
MATERFTVRVEKELLVFCCGHFISYRGHQCEKLHGHNYRAAIEIEGPLTGDYYVVDFVALKQLAREITDELDHHMLIATRNPVIRVEESAPNVRVTYADRQWLFPRVDCILLPIENTTAELLARYIAGRLLESLRSREGFVPTLMRVEVEEAPGVSALVELRP